LLAEHEDRGTEQLEASVIARQLNITMIKINHYLDLLEKKRYIDVSIFYNGRHPIYGLDAKGRAFLIGHQLI
jgi:hypothetical protein